MLVSLSFWYNCWADISFCNRYPTTPPDAMPAARPAHGAARGAPAKVVAAAAPTPDARPAPALTTEKAACWGARAIVCVSMSAGSPSFVSGAITTLLSAYFFCRSSESLLAALMILLRKELWSATPSSLPPRIALAAAPATCKGVLTIASPTAPTVSRISPGDASS